MSESPTPSEVEVGQIASPAESEQLSVPSGLGEDAMQRFLDFQTRFLEDQADRDTQQVGLLRNLLDQQADRDRRLEEREDRQADLVQRLVDQQTDRDRRQEDREDRQAESMKALIEEQHLIVKQLVTKEEILHQDVGTQRNLKLGESEITSHREGAHKTTGQADCKDYWEDSLPVPPVSTSNYPRVTVASLLPTSDQGRPPTTAKAMTTVNDDVRGQEAERANASIRPIIILLEVSIISQDLKNTPEY